MEKIIEFSKDYRNLYSKIIKELKNTKIENYSFSDITNYANRILEASRDFNPKKRKSQTLIVKTTKEFGINVYLETMKSEIIGCIKVNGDTKQQYNVTDKVILVNKTINAGKYSQRFVTAYLLAYYLFAYLGSESQCKKEYFYAEFMSQDSRIEKIADKFAMDILMPKELFIEQHNIAVKVDSSSYFVLEYLSRYFEVPIQIVAKRIKDIRYN